jgi:hypothetical protein
MLTINMAHAVFFSVAEFLYIAVTCFRPSRNDEIWCGSRLDKIEWSFLVEGAEDR